MKSLMTGVDESASNNGYEGTEGHKCGFVAVIGKPNSGKSTLMNELVGEKLSIVTPKANTTRHRVLGIISDEQHQAILLDTPGVMDFESSQLDKVMMKNMRTAVMSADAVIVLLDGKQRPMDQLKELLPEKYRPLKAPNLVVVNKRDLLREEEISEVEMELGKEPHLEARTLASALNANGMDFIRKWIVDSLPVGPKLYPEDALSHHPERFFVAEIIRERAMGLFQQEVPYAMQVTIPYFKERPNAKDYILAEITVERDSQKAIILGHKGKALRQLGKEAREGIEEFLGRPVYLDTQVRVRKKWRKRSNSVRFYDTSFSPL